MGRADAPALRGSWLGGLLRLWNPVMRRLLASPLHRLLSRWFAVLSWAGPRTGRAHSIPVSYVSEGGHAYATTGDGWWRNAARARDVAITLRGRRLPARVIPVTDAAASVREHARLFRDHPFFRRLAGIPASPTGVPDDDAIRRSVAAGRTLLRIELL
jgi:hypothetical protein